MTILLCPKVNWKRNDKKRKELLLVLNLLISSQFDYVVLRKLLHSNFCGHMNPFCNISDSQVGLTYKHNSRHGLKVILLPSGLLIQTRA